MVPEESFEKNLSSAQRAAQALGFPPDRLGGMSQVRSALQSAPPDHLFDEATAAISVGLKSKRRLAQLRKEGRGPPYVLKNVEHEGTKAAKAASKGGLTKHKPRMVGRRHYVHEQLRAWEQQRSLGVKPTPQQPTVEEELIRLGKMLGRGDLSICGELLTAIVALNGSILGFAELHTVPMEELERAFVTGARLEPMSLKAALSGAWVHDAERSRWESIYLGTLRNALAAAQPDREGRQG